MSPGGGTHHLEEEDGRLQEGGADGDFVSDDGLMMMRVLPVEGSPGKPSHGEMVLNHCVVAPSAGDEEQAGAQHRLENPGSGAFLASAPKPCPQTLQDSN